MHQKQAHPNPTPSEFCPNCGNFVSALNDETGWCYNCSPDASSGIISNWLNTNANHVEHYIAQGNSVTVSINIVADNLRPICVVCSEEIPHAKRGSIFCRRHPQCRRFQRRYVYLYSRRGFTKIEALAQILKELE